jgi:hypothetical protein
MCSNDEFDLRHLLTDARSRAFDSRLRDIYFFLPFFFVGVPTQRLFWGSSECTMQPVSIRSFFWACSAVEIISEVRF